MKILKQEDISNWEYQFKCDGCNSELLADKDDLKYHSYEGYYNEPSTESYYVTCPVCQRTSNIEFCMIPNLLKIQLKQKPKPHDCGGPFDR